MILAALSALILGTTPEATVKEFVAAFNAGKFSEARRMLASPGNNDVDPYLTKVKLRITLLRCSLQSNDGSSAVVICKGNSNKAGGTDYNAIQGIEEEVQLSKVGGDWKIKLDLMRPSNGALPTVFAAVFMLGPMGMTTFSRAKNFELRSETLQKAKGLATAFYVFLAYHDDVLPKFSNWVKAVKPYVKSDSLFTVEPDKKGTCSWTFNKNLSGKVHISIEPLSNTILLYLSKNGKVDYRFDGYTVVAMCDGSARALTESQLAKYRWK